MIMKRLRRVRSFLSRLDVRLGAHPQERTMSINVFDVAAYILKQTGPVTAMKLQKLVYYAKAWHAVWESDELFPERFEAWANGPVSPALYQAHKGSFMVDSLSKGDPDAVESSPEAASSIRGILTTYAPMSAAELSTLTHRESPWSDARGDLLPGQRSHAEITVSAMAEYYSSLI